ncbi:MAG: hypothetical protein KDK48_05625 [Chlamydiia bacterium]|nr:hypothetical protein [Chlamydiia bacterium]
MNGMNIESRLAKAQSENDHLLTELAYVDGLLKEVGFDEGLLTLKAAAEEIVGTPDAY